MTRADALKKLRKVLGPKMTWSENVNAPRGPEQRDAASAQLTAAREQKAVMEAARNARYRAVLAADAEYQTLLAEYKRASMLFDKLASEANRYRCCVSVVELGMFNMVKAKGDNWAEVVSKVVR